MQYSRVGCRSEFFVKVGDLYFSYIYDHDIRDIWYGLSADPIYLFPVLKGVS